MPSARAARAHLDEWLPVALRTPGDLADPMGPSGSEEMMRDFTAMGSTGVLTPGAGTAGFLAMTRKSYAALFVLASVIGGVSSANHEVGLCAAKAGIGAAWGGGLYGELSLGTLDDVGRGLSDAGCRWRARRLIGR